MKSKAPLLIIQDHAASLIHGDGRLNCFQDPQELERHLKAQPLQETSLLFDCQTLTYVYEPLPKIPIWDRYRLSQNRLDRLAKHAPIKGRFFYDTRHVGLAHIPDSPWGEVLQRLKIPIKHVSAAQLELLSLLKASETEWVLGIYENQEGRTTHLVVHQGRLLHIRYLQPSKTPEIDIQTTLAYSSRFSLSSTKGSIIQIGKSKQSLGKEMNSLKAHHLYQDGPIEQILFEKHRRWKRNPFRFKTHPYKKNYFNYIVPKWGVRVVWGYTTCAFLIAGLLGSQILPLLKDLTTYRTKLSALTKAIEAIETKAPHLHAQLIQLKVNKQKADSYHTIIDCLTILRKYKPSGLQLVDFSWSKGKGVVCLLQDKRHPSSGKSLLSQQDLSRIAHHVSVLGDQMEAKVTILPNKSVPLKESSGCQYLLEKAPS